MINVTQSFLPPMEEYIKHLEKIWASKQLTNHGPLVLELEDKLRQYLGVKHFFFVTNGTIALQIAIKALGLRNEVITTPFSYVATTSSLVWESCKPVFADIDPNTCTIDVASIEAQLNNKTTAILATHVYGNPCRVEEIQALADTHGLSVIYDAAHAFGVRYKGRSVLEFGDISTLSFHATKLFHTIEGGGVVTNNDELAHKIAYMRNFGHNGAEAFLGVGINGKSSEFQAAMGLCVLPHIPDLIRKRKAVSDLYTDLIEGLPLRKPELQIGTDQYNYAYFPVIFDTEAQLIKSIQFLNKNNIIPRRYFYPSLNTLNYVENNLAFDISTDISSRVLCLPLYDSLTADDVKLIVGVIRNAL